MEEMHTTARAFVGVTNVSETVDGLR